MRKFLICAVAVLMTVGASAQTSKSIYNKFCEEKGVIAVYISPSMFKMIGKIPEAGGTDLNPIIQTLDAMYILNCEEKKSSASLQDDVQKLVSSKKMELMMEARDEGEVVRMYTISEGEIIRDFIMLVSEDDDFTFIGIEGKIDPKKLAELIEKMDN